MVGTPTRCCPIVDRRPPTRRCGQPLSCGCSTAGPPRGSCATAARGRGVRDVLRGIVFGSVLVGQWVWIGAGAGVTLFAWEGPVGRRAGAEPLRWPTRWRVTLVTAGVVAILARACCPRFAGRRRPRVSWSGALVGRRYLLARWCAGCGRVRRPWRDGVARRRTGLRGADRASRAQWVHPDRLAVLTGLPRDRCDEWCAACVGAWPRGDQRAPRRPRCATPRSPARPASPGSTDGPSSSPRRPPARSAVHRLHGPDQPR